MSDAFIDDGSGYGGAPWNAPAPAPILDHTDIYNDPFFDDEFFSVKNQIDLNDPFFDDEDFFVDDPGRNSDMPTVFGDGTDLLKTLGNTLPRWFASSVRDQQSPYGYSPIFNPSHAQKSLNPMPSTSPRVQAGFMTGTKIGDGIIIGGMVLVAIFLAMGLRK